MKHLLLQPLLLAAVLAMGAVRAADRPNIVIIFIDDMGYADIGPFGAKGYATPALDRMAAEGTKFTSFYSAQAVCSASRTALLTGCYPNRIGITGALAPHSPIGINPEETTLAEICKSRGYATACFGKWHLGDAKQFLPLQHGFDEYFGLPYSNDMTPMGAPHGVSGQRKGYVPLPLICQNTVVNLSVDDAAQDQLTTWYTEHAVDFIHRNKDRPFFLYLPHTMVHVPLHVSDKFRGKSTRGLFGDAVEELDWSVGQVMAALKEDGLDEKTLVVFTSDNGPWLCFGDHAGSAGSLREGKGTSWDGGVREPTLMRWPTRIPAGRACDAPLMTIDLLPTVASLIGAPLPQHKIDGVDITGVITGKSDQSPHEALAFYYHRNSLEALRSGKWKLEFPRSYVTLADKHPGTGGKMVAYAKRKITNAELYDLDADPGQQHDVAAANPEVMLKLNVIAEKFRDDLGDELTKRPGSGRRAPGKAAPDAIYPSDERFEKAVNNGKTVHGNIELLGPARGGLPKAGFSWDQSPTHLAMRNGDKTVWNLNFDPKEPKSYFHPLSTVEGEELTAFRPNDHRWHRGLWFSWKFINGLNYWEENPKTGVAQGLTEITASKVTANPDFSATIALDLSYHPPGKPAVLTERRTLAVSAPDGNGSYTIDWTSVFTVGGEPVVLDRTPPSSKGGVGWGGYAGLSLRFPPGIKGWSFKTSEGVHGAAEGNGKNARWVDFSNASAGITIFDHPNNIRRPSPWYLNEQLPYFSPALLYNEPLTLAAKQAITLRYRVLVHRAGADLSAHDW